MDVGIKIPISVLHYSSASRCINNYGLEGDSGGRGTMRPRGKYLTSGGIDGDGIWDSREWE